MADEQRWNGEGEEEQEEEEIDETVYKSQKDAVLFAIEVSSSMLTPPPPTDAKKKESDSPTIAALKCAYALMQQRIISHPNDMMGVLLYGTEQTKFQEEEQARGSLSYPHCYLLNELDVPSADDVRMLRDMVEDEDESKQLLRPSSEPVSMANVLFCANQIFTTKAPNFSSRRLFIVTDNDDPHKGEPALKSSAAVRAKDLYDLGVVIELFPISRQDHDFDRTKFYEDIIYNQLPTDPEAPAPVSGSSASSSKRDGISLLQSLLSSINSKAVPRRALFSAVPLEIGPGFRISVKGYIVFKRQMPQRSCYLWLGGEKPQIAKGVTTQLASDSARAVEKIEIKKAFKFGGDQITFTPEEISKLRHFGEPIIRIIGFKPMSLLPIWANTKHATFLYPAEDDFVGSTRVFSALHQKLLRDEKMGLTWFIARKNATPVAAALLPGAEEVDEGGLQVMPPGLWLIPLPFADDIRQNPETILLRSPDSLTDCMKNIVQQLQLPRGIYDPAKYPNPSLQWHYRILQAMALDEDLPEKPEDKTIPKYKQIHKRVSSEAIEWGRELEQQDQKLNDQGSSSAVPSKRGAPRSQGDLPVRTEKKARTAALSDHDGLSEEDMRKAFDKGLLGKFSVVQLSAWLKAKGIKATGNKAALVTRIEDHFDT